MVWVLEEVSWKDKVLGFTLSGAGAGFIIGPCPQEGLVVDIVVADITGHGLVEML